MSQVVHLSFSFNNSTTQGKLNPFNYSLNYLNFFNQRLIHHYSHHSDEKPPMIKVSEFLNSLNTKQFCIKIQVQRENFAKLDYSFGNHIHFDNDSIRTTLCQFSDTDCLFIIEGTTESGQEVKLFWGEKHFELLKQITICNETITEYNLLKQQIQTNQCIDLNKLKTVFIVVCKKDAITLIDDKNTS